MPTSNAEFKDSTTGSTVVAAYPEHVKDKIVLITGGNPGGIGGATAVSLAQASPKMLIITTRDANKLKTTIQNIKDINSSVAVKTLSLDLSSQSSVKQAAKEILNDASIPQIDILINNAGVMNIEERTLSVDGIEMQFATNHIGHYLFTNLILPKLITASKAATTRGSTRIINLSSRAVMYGPVRFSDWNFTKKQVDLPESEHMSGQVRTMWDQTEDKPYIPQAAYGQSKSANVLFTRELNTRLYQQHGILSVAVHPGGVMTELGRHMKPEVLEGAFEKMKQNSPGFFMKNIEQGCSTSVVAALDPKLTVDDLFMADCQVAGWAPPYSTDPAKAKQLWSLSEEIVGQKFLE